MGHIPNGVYTAEFRSEAVKLERDLLKSVRRILRRIRGEIRTNRAAATSAPGGALMPIVERIRKRLSRMA